MVSRWEQTLRQAGCPDADFDARELYRFVTGRDPRFDDGPTPAEAARLDELTARRAAREPLQYILGEWEFMGLPLKVGPGVLCPRADTEVLVDYAVKHLPRGARFLDLCTGSGCIAVSTLAARPDLSAVALDKSDAALAVAKRNADRIGVGDRLTFLCGDALTYRPDIPFDALLSNPPYISEQEMKTLMPEVLREPELALYGGEDGLDFYRRITREAPAHLARGGYLLFEIGWQQKEAVEALLRAHIGEPFALRDYGGNWRVVGAMMGK